jgi:protein-disulfide isomerase
MPSMKNILLASLISTAFAAPLAFAQNASKPAKAASAKTFTSAELDSLVNQLAASGKLDAAIDAGIQRYGAAQQAKMNKERQQKELAISEMAKNARKVSATRDHIYGNPKADFSMIVYSDLECSFCKRHSEVPENLAKTIGVDKINVVFRHLPLPNHGDAAKREAVASECVAKQAGNDGFFKFVNLVLQNTQLNGQGLKNGDAGIAALARDSGVKDEAAFASCMQDVKMQAIVQADMEDAQKAGVGGTPGNIFRNNKTGASIAAHGSLPASALEVRARAFMTGKN